MTGPGRASNLLAPFSSAIARRRIGPLILMYHGLGGSDGVHPGEFVGQIEALAERRRVVPLAEAAASLGRPEAAELAVITFDDGYVDFAELAVPALMARGLHATVFVPAGRVGATNDWDAGSAPKRQILSSRELRSLPADTVEIGLHGSTHCRLAGLPPSSLQQETTVARERLEDACGRPVRFFAYPYGQADDFDAAAEEAVEASGCLAACSTRFGRGSVPSERFRLRRIGIRPADSQDVVERKLDGFYDWIAIKEALGVRRRRLARSVLP